MSEDWDIRVTVRRELNRVTAEHWAGRLPELETKVVMQERLVAAGPSPDFDKATAALHLDIRKARLGVLSAELSLARHYARVLEK
jgi:hypothetical protein